MEGPVAAALALVQRPALPPSTRVCVYARTHVNLFHSTTGMKNNKNTECESLQIPQEYFRRRSGIYDGKKIFSPTLCLHSVCFGGLYIQYPIQYPCGVLNDSGITVTTAYIYRTFLCTHNYRFNFLDAICSHCTHAPALVRHTTHLSRVWDVRCGA